MSKFQILEGSSPEEGIKAYVQAPGSDRIVLIESDDFCCWAYLTDEDGNVPEVGVLIYNSCPNPTFEESLERHEQGFQPPLPEEYATNESIHLGVQIGDLEAHWDEMNDAVLVTLKGEPWAIIEVKEQIAYSRSIRALSPYGHAWDQGVYLEYFAHLEFKNI
jgi:hypothetical protein